MQPSRFYLDWIMCASFLEKLVYFSYFYLCRIEIFFLFVCHGVVKNGLRDAAWEVRFSNFCCLLAGLGHEGDICCFVAITYLLYILILYYLKI